MKKVLAVCASPYQVLALNRLIDEYYLGDEIILALADTIADLGGLYAKALEEPRFSKVYLWEIKGRYNFSQTVKIINAFMGERKSEILTSHIGGIREKYDVFLFANISPAVMHIGTVLKKYNSKIEIGMFEDGFSTYSNYTGDFLLQGGFKGYARRFFRNMSFIYSFAPELFEWKPRCEIKVVKRELKKETLDRLNRIFDYASLEDKYDAKVIFFEESFVADGREFDDLELVDLIADIVGKENIYVKIHPRNPVNRFKEKGYKTNENTAVPWELIACNTDMSEKILVTVSSSAVMNTFFMLGEGVTAYMLYECTDYPDAIPTGILPLQEKCCKAHRDIFIIPESKESLKKLKWEI